MMMNNLNNLADKAVTDEELEQVSGGTMYAPCPKCGATMVNWVCPNCG